MLTKKAFLFTLFINFNFLLFGCTTSYVDGNGRLHFSPSKEQTSQLRNKKSCCEYFWEIPYQKIDFEKKYKLIVNNELPTFNFPTGKSYLLAFEIPIYYKTLEISIESYFKQSLFYPKVTILDHQFHIIKSVSDKAIRHEFTPKFSRAYLYGKFTINETNDIAKYILIHTSDRLLEGRLLNNAGSRSGYDIHFGSEGEITLKLSML